MNIRPTTDGDLDAILVIINREIREGVAHFGVEPYTLDELKGDLAAAQDRYAFLSAIVDGEVAGYAKGGPWKTRAAYRWAAEIGVYVAQGMQGRGVGRSLYEVLFPALHARGIRTLIAGITLPNDASVRLHESMGMTHAATFHKVGYKHGGWRDTGYWELHWGKDEAPPSL
jgi:phosphinothricin acetyltransferase